MNKTLPVAFAAEKYGASEETVVRSLAMSYLITFYIMANIGRTAAICNCFASASAGVAASITFKRGGSDEKIKAAVKNVLAPLAGLLCDGAKPGCALKMGLAVTQAISAAVFALNNVEVRFYDGVADGTLEYALKNLSVLAQQSQPVLETGMANIALEKEARYKKVNCAK
jgi:L-cysteine desulfidase